jgi:Protein of unknown function (DUF2786).
MGLRECFVAGLEEKHLSQDSIVEKVRKLLALANGNQNEHERGVAMQFAMDLLAKHNLTISEVECDKSLLNTIEIEGDFRLEAWTKIILQAACKMYYTELYLSGRFDYFRYRRVDVPVFVGTAENIAVTMDVATWLIDSVRKESNRAYKHASERRSFRLGASDRILERAFAMVETEKEKANSGNGRELMVVRNQLEAANQAYLAKLNLRYTRARTSYVSSDAYSDGTAFGSQVKLRAHDSEKKVYGLLPDFTGIR